jgi:hypothetical protein
MNISWQGRDGAKKFVPHEFGRQVSLTAGLPRVLLTRDAYEDMYCLVDEVAKEVGWIGSVEQVGCDYLIKEVFLLDQESHSTTCEITTDGLAEWASRVLAERSDGMEVVNSVRFWGHSHVNMGTSPSGQDDSQMRVFSESCDDFFIRGILNKAGRMEFTLYIFSLGLEIKDCEWQLHEPVAADRRAHWQQEIRTKVREKQYPVHTNVGVGGFDRYPFAGSPSQKFMKGTTTAGEGKKKKKSRSAVRAFLPDAARGGEHGR